MKTRHCAAIILTLTLACCPLASAADYATFESFYESGGLNLWDWAIIITTSVIAGVVTYFTCGAAAAAASPWFATVGGWIGSWAGYSGIAAVNYGLAVLGGGSVAAGGMGIIGGAAVLSTAGTFGVEVLAGYGIDIAQEKWDLHNFKEANKDMLMLPPARNEKGGQAYKSAITYLLDNYIKEGDGPEGKISSKRNQEVLKEASNIVSRKLQSEKDKDYLLKDKVLLSLLYLQTNRYDEAEQMAHEAVILATEIKETPSLPSFIRALAELSSSDKPCTREIIQSLRLAYHHEPDNFLIPLMTAACLDRMMYKYHFGLLKADDLAEFCDIITYESIDKDLAAASLEVFTSRCLVELKRTQQDILIIIEKNPELAKNPEVAQVVRERYNQHEQLITLMKRQTLEKLKALASEFEDLRENAEDAAAEAAKECAEKEAEEKGLSSKETKEAVKKAVEAARNMAKNSANNEAKVRKLLDQYSNYLPTLSQRIEEACTLGGANSIDSPGTPENTGSDDTTQLPEGSGSNNSGDSQSQAG